MGIKRVYKRLKKSQERFLEQSESVVEASITRMKLKSKADGVGYALKIIEEECPEVKEIEEEMKLHIAKGRYVAILKATGEEYKIVHCQLDPLTKEIQSLTVEDLRTYLQLDIPEEYFNDWEIKEVEEP